MLPSLMVRLLTYRPLWLVFGLVQVDLGRFVDLEFRAVLQRDRGFAGRMGPQAVVSST